MSTARENRTRLNNSWPATFLFPTEEALIKRLAKDNLVSIFLPVHLEHSNDHNFQNLLSLSIDALDYLPLRPDFSFEQVWKALDAEFFRLKSSLGTAPNLSRFSAFATHVASSQLTSKSHYALAVSVPLQTCEFLAKRILDSKSNPNEHSDAFIKRVKNSLGESMLADIHSKYDSNWLAPKKRAETQRKLGGLIKLILAGKPVLVENNNYQLSSSQVAQFIISTVLPQFRNERFHGNVRPPFRSSTATLKTYAHAYFIFIYAYALLCEVFLYRGFGVVQPQNVIAATQNNLNRFIQVLGDQASA